MHKIRILVVDDDIGVVRLLRANLQAWDYETLVAMDGAEALQSVDKHLPDLMILDITMPKINGFQVCQQIRQWSQMPIIMLSAQHDADEKIKCLDCGADDYITKPFEVNELVARVKAVLRRARGDETSVTVPVFTSGNFKINFVERRVTLAEREVRLTPTEYSLLKELVLNAGKVLSHATLLRQVWGPEYAVEKEYLRVFIGRLRHYLETDTDYPQYIITVPGVGYKFQKAS